MLAFRDIYVDKWNFFMWMKNYILGIYVIICILNLISCYLLIAIWLFKISHQSLAHGIWV